MDKYGRERRLSSFEVAASPVVKGRCNPPLVRGFVGGIWFRNDITAGRRQLLIAWFAELNVCQIYLHGLSPEKGGGVASYLYGLVSTTHKIIHYTLLVGLDKEDLRRASKLYTDKATIRAVSSTNCVLDSIRLAGYYRKLAQFDVIQINDLYNLPDIIRHLLLILLVRFFSSAKLVFASHTAADRSGNVLLRGVYEFLFRRVSRHWDAVVCNSSYMLSLLVESCAMPRKRMKIIHNGVDVEMYRKARSLSLRGHPAILFVGHLWPEKGVDILLQAFQLANRQVPGSRLHIVGNGGHEAEYKKLAHDLGIQDNIQFHGVKSRDELSRFYKRADICAIPSRVESFGIVALEAMASGTPVVATRVGGLPEIIKQNRNGELVEPTAKSLSLALVKLSRDRLLCKRIRKFNERDARYYDWYQASERYVNLYREVCSLQAR